MNPIISLIRSDKIIVLTIFIFSVLINYYSAYRGIFPMDSFSHYDIGFRIWTQAARSYIYQETLVISPKVMNCFKDLE